MKKVVVSGMLGNGLEWYDFAIYGQLAFILSHLFFPAGDPAAQLLATFGVFAVGFVFRPLGAILFGWIGDTYGRRLALVIAILMMAIPTGCIGLLPTYAEIGMWAPVFLTIIRIFQGLSLGGEFSGSIVYIVEHAPPHRRGLAGSASVTSLVVGFMLGTLVAWLTKTTMSTEDFESWGWRVPFLLGIAVGVVGLYIRKSCGESPEYEAAKGEGMICQTPVREAILHHPKQMLQAFGAYLAVTMPFYLVSIYFITYTATELGQPTGDALLINTMVMGCMLVGMLISAVAGDRYGRRRVMMLGAFIMAIAAIPAFYLMEAKTFGHILAAQALLGLLVGFYTGSIPALLVDLFPTRVRFTGMAISYNLAAALFGGTTPMVAVWLIGATGTHYSLAAYVILCCTLSFIALWTYRERATG